MKVLVHVVRGQPEEGNDFVIPRLNIHRHPQVIMTDDLTDNPDRWQKEGMFFLIDPRDEELFINHMAKQNPGCEIRAYHLSQVAQAAVGEVFLKKVTEDGILPA